MKMNDRMEQVERWANFVKNNPDKWKKIHTEFINAQFEKHQKFVRKILSEKNGFEKLVEIYRIKNVEAYRKILSVDK